MSSTISKKASWAALPEEIHLLILEELVHGNDCSLAPLATVSRQWQSVIERYNFKQIKLTMWRMPEFDSMTRRNRALVESIWLSLELEEYSCPACEGDTTNDTRMIHKTDNCLIIKAMHDLFQLLSTWESRQLDKKLALDISIYSPSDSQHHFKYITFGPDAPSHDPTFVDQLHDPQHGWISGKQSSAPPKQALEHVHKKMLRAVFWNEECEKAWWRTLPKVPIVSSILFRLQNRRRFTPTTLGCMFSRLPNLEEIHYEPWRSWSAEEETAIDQGNCLLLDSLTHSDSLKKLVLFENFDELYSSQFAGSGNGHPTNLRTPNQDLGRAITKASLKLHHLSASFIIEADHFLSAAKKEAEWNWPHLRSLTLTSQRLKASGFKSAIDQMLLEAAAVALKMPKLETFEIWNGQAGLAALFRYQVSDYRAVLTWKANWEHPVPSHVAKAWEAVAHAHRKSRPLLLLEHSVDNMVLINSHADAINYLQLFKVLRPISLQQILTAHIARDEGLPQGLGLIAPRATDKKSPFRGKHWARALAYYNRIMMGYFLAMREDFEPLQRPEDP